MKKYEAAYKNKKEADKYLEMAKDKIKKEMKDVYGIILLRKQKMMILMKNIICGSRICCRDVLLFLARQMMVIPWMSNMI